MWCYSAYLSEISRHREFYTLREGTSFAYRGTEAACAGLSQTTEERVTITNVQVFT